MYDHIICGRASVHFKLICSCTCIWKEDTCTCTSKRSILFFFTLCSIWTLLEHLNIKCLQMHVHYLHVILTLDLVSGAWYLRDNNVYIKLNNGILMKICWPEMSRHAHTHFHQRLKKKKWITTPTAPYNENGLWTVAGSILGSGSIFSWRLVMESFLWPLFPRCWFK